MAVIKVGNNSIGKISVIEPYDDPIGTPEYKPEGPWVRPSEWLDMPNFSPGEQKASILAFIPSGSNDVPVEVYTRGLLASGNNTYSTIDWGDGSALSVASGSSTTSYHSTYIQPQVHYYNYNDLPAQSEFQKNGMTCRQALITVDGSVSGIEVLYVYNFNNTQNAANGNNYQSYNILDMHVEAPTIKNMGFTSKYVGYPSYIERLVINATGEFASTAGLCANMINLRVFEFPSGITSNNTSFNSMFHSCEKLQTIPSLDTSSATDVAGMFAYTYSLREIPNIDTSNVTDFSSFLVASNLDYIPELDYSNGTNFQSVFNSMYRLKTIPAGLDFSSATNINSMFSYCYNLRSMPNNFFDNFTNVTTADSAFISCVNLKNMARIDLPNCTNMRKFAQGCNQLEKLHIGDVRSMPTASYSSNGNFREAFSYLYSVKSIEIDYPDETWASGMYFMFGSCHSLKKAPKINLSKAYWVANFLSSCSSLETAPVYDLSNANDYQSFFNSCSNLKSVGGFRFGDRKAATGQHCFYRCYRLEEFPSGLFQDHYSTPDNSSYMFRETAIQKIPDITISGATSTLGNTLSLMYKLTDVGNITFCSGEILPGFFASNNKLSHIGSWDVSEVENLTNAFNGCRSLAWSDIRGTKCDVGYNDCLLGSGAIENIFNNLASGVAGKTIDIRSNWGTSLLHSDTIAIATSKGWTVTT